MALGEAARLGDGDVAGVGAGAGDDVAGQLGAGPGHADGLEAGVQHRQLRLGEAAEHDVLAVATGARRRRARAGCWRAQRNCDGGDVAERGVGDGRHGAVGGAADHRLVATQRPYGSRGVSATAHALADGGGLARWCSRPAGASPALARSAGMPPGHDDEAGSVWRTLSTRRRTSSMPSWSTTHFRRARSLLSRLPVCSNTRRMASIVGSRSSRDVKSSSASAGCGVAPRPPAMYTRKPGSTRAVGQRAGGGDDAGVVEHRLAAVGAAAGEVDLELARQALAQRVAHEVLERGLGPRGDVEHLVRAGAGEVAGHHVADGVAAGLAAGEADRRRCRRMTSGTRVSST